MSIDQAQWVASGGQATDVSIAMAGYLGDERGTVRLITPLANGDGNLEVVVWEFDGVAAARRGDSRHSGPVVPVDMVDSCPSPATDGLVVTAVRDSGTKLLRLLFWWPGFDAEGVPHPQVVYEAPDASTHEVKRLAVTRLNEWVVTAILREEDDKLSLHVWEYVPLTVDLLEEVIVSGEGGGPRPMVLQVQEVGQFVMEPHGPQLLGSGVKDVKGTRLAMVPWAEGVVTAIRHHVDGDLHLQAWKIKADGSIAKQGTATAGKVDDVAMAAVSDHRVVTAVRNTNNQQLEVIVWDLSEHGGTITRRGTDFGPPVAEIHRGLAIASLGPELLGDVLFAYQQVVTASRETNGALKISLWHVGQDGSLVLSGDIAPDDVKALSMAYCRSEPTYTTGGVEVTRRQALVAAERSDGHLGLFQIGAAPDDVVQDIRAAEQLEMVMEDQLTGHWCYAAVATSISKFYDPQSHWTQCKLANLQMDRDDCCDDPAPGECDKGGSLHDALETVGNLVLEIDSQITFGNVQAWISAGRPIALRIEWDGGARHAVAIDGYEAHEGEFVTVRDPNRGDSVVDFESFKQAYLGTGRWTASFYTTP